MNTSDKPKTIDLERAAELVRALERDLEKVSGDARDMQRLRDEVATLRNVLDSPVQRHHWVSDSLHDIRSLLEESLDEAVHEGITLGRYAAEIGRILGL
jgi:hypothetical protein